MESYKTYDDSVLIKSADIGQVCCQLANYCFVTYMASEEFLVQFCKICDVLQMIMVKEEGDSVPDEVEYRHGLTPPMRDARRRRFRREPDLNVCGLVNCLFFQYPLSLSLLHTQKNAQN